MVSNITKDGFTVLKHITVDKPIELFLKDNIRDICTSVIKKIGDGTTSAIVLSQLIFEGLLALREGTKLSKRVIIKAFKNILSEVSERIMENAREATIEDIYNIALTALNGQEEYAHMIEDIYKESGMNVFIDVAISNDNQSRTVTYNGMSYNVGYISPAFINNDSNNCLLPDPMIYVFESPIDTPEMTAILQMIIHKNIEDPMYAIKKAQAANKSLTGIAKPVPTLIIAPYISRDVNSYLDQLINAFSAVNPIQRPPLCIVSGINNNNQYLLDIMSLTGAKFIKKYIDPETYENDKKLNLAPTEKNIHTFAGSAEKVIIDALNTRIINPDKMYEKNETGQIAPTEFYKNYINQLEDLLHKYEETREELVKIGQLKRRINILKGNMVDFYVGGIGIADRDSLRDSVEDAVLNCRSAAKEGVGYGANYEGLSALNKLSIELESEMKTLDEKLNNEDTPDEEKEEIKKSQYDLLIRKGILTILLNAYTELGARLYFPYTDNIQQAVNIVLQGLANENEEERCPFNLLTEQFDKKILTSIQTEPASLEAISKIISLLFDSNQFILPTPEYNIYEMCEESSTIVVDTTEKSEKEILNEQ